MVDTRNEVADVFIAAERGRGAKIGFAGVLPGVGVVVVLAEIGSFLVISVVPGAQAAVDGLDYSVIFGREIDFRFGRVSNFARGCGCGCDGGFGCAVGSLVAAGGVVIGGAAGAVSVETVVSAMEEAPSSFKASDLGELIGKLGEIFVWGVRGGGGRG